MTMVDDIIDAARVTMQKAVDAFESAVQKISAPGVSTIAAIEVDEYGTPTPLSQVATLTVVDPQLITIKPWQSNMVDVIVNAIRAADLGVNPEADSELVRVPIPPLGLEQLRELSKQVNATAEPARVAVRAARTDAMDKLSAPEILADDRTSGEQRLQALTDKSIATIDDLAKAKQRELEA
jgi:ribosome recycling factor